VTSGTETTPDTSRAVLRRDLKNEIATRPVHTRRARPARKRVGIVKAGLAGFAVLGLAAACLSPLGAVLTPAANASEATPVTLYTSALGDAQTVQVASQMHESAKLERSSYAAAVKPKPKPTHTAETTAQPASFTATFVAPSAGTAQAIAYKMVTARGWSDNEFSCLVALWNRESGWRVNAANPSGAYGIPQALPGSKMASAGADWATNPATQIAWGLGYITSRYGTPCGAWGHSQSTGWY
jgi:hypothetical protein